MSKSPIGVKKNYQKQYEQLQRDMQGVKPWVKRNYYSDFYKAIAKTADQRLVELERLSKKKGYKEVTEWAYANAMRDIRSMFGEDAKRFNRKLPDKVNLNTLYKDINKILNFLNAPTSSVSGIDIIYDKRAKTLNKDYGTNLNWDTTGRLFESRLWKKTGAKKASATALKAIGVLQANRKEILRALSKGEKIAITVPEEIDEKTGEKKKDINVQEEVNRFLRYYKKDVNTLIKQLK